ncbi:hypothetical protein C8A00DRAFT_31830 [Chaetomidium leptoderma]|uniref:Uncharacterized protein n=1 Tax=Chaetomidium leptoderma TaxID=669021 RepID=A0AAN6VPR5_9PEZI|nr:hypothetical protein C8A00DRAFT_31830 [Chaetomidium leptoderma]
MSVPPSHFNTIRAHGDANHAQQLTWTNEIRLNHALNWQGLLSYSEGFYNELEKHPVWKSHHRSLKGNSLVATLCYPIKDGCILFQGTIPGKSYRNMMFSDGAVRAPKWWRANSKVGPSGTEPRRGPHPDGIDAEDGVEFALECAQRERSGQDTLPPQDGPLRIIVYGIKVYQDNTTKTGIAYRTGQTDLCTASSFEERRKDPPCQVVAQRLNILFLDKKLAKQQDSEDSPASSQYSDIELTPAEFDALVNNARKHPRPPSSSNGSQYNLVEFTPAEYDALANTKGPSRPPSRSDGSKSSPGGPQAQAPGAQAPGARRPENNKMDRLAQSMSMLSTGGRSVAPPRPSAQTARATSVQLAGRTQARNTGDREAASRSAANDPRKNQPASRDGPR